MRRSILFYLFTMIQALTAQEMALHRYNELSEELLLLAIEGKETQMIREKLAIVHPDSLKEYLDTDSKRIAFWVNLYNAYVQYLLRDDPALFDRKGKFFNKKRIPIAGRMLSLDQIEHGIIRKSQWKFGLGRIGKLIPSSFEKKLRVRKRDARIHFVLNCGARSCPPVRILSPEKLEHYMEQATREYLEKSTVYDESRNVVYVTSLFYWFRGDFGNRSGFHKMLTEHGIIPRGERPNFKKQSYDWTLDLENIILQ